MPSNELINEHTNPLHTLKARICNEGRIFLDKAAAFLPSSPASAAVIFNQLSPASC